MINVDRLFLLLLRYFLFSFIVPSTIMLAVKDFWFGAKVRIEVRAQQLANHPHVPSTYLYGPCNRDLHIVESFRSRPMIEENNK